MLIEAICLQIVHSCVCPVKEVHNVASDMIMLYPEMIQTSTHSILLKICPPTDI